MKLTRLQWPLTFKKETFTLPTETLELVVTIRDQTGKVTERALIESQLPALLTDPDQHPLWFKLVNHYGTPVDSIGSLEDFLERFPQYLP